MFIHGVILVEDTCGGSSSSAPSDKYLYSRCLKFFGQFDDLF